MPSPSARRSLLFPILVCLLAGGLVAWLHLSQHTMRSPGSLIVGLLGLLLISLWWALGRAGQRLKRLFFLLLIGTLLGISARRVIRYEGSADGTAMPRFTWVWSQTQSAPLPVLPALSSATPGTDDLGPLPDGLADWTRFMGLQGDGQLPAPSWKTDWAAHPPREVWRQPTGLGWSGFVVAGRRAVTLEQRGEEECVTCYDVVTGKLLWSHASPHRFSEPLGGDGPRATPTLDPATQTVYTLGATGMLTCLDLVTGMVRWSRDVLKDAGAGNLTYGLPGAPLLVDEKVIVTGGNKAPNLLAYHRESGEPVWQSTGADAASYSAPIIRTLSGQEQIIQINQGSVSGHDIATGKQLWTFEWPGSYPKVGQPCQVGADRLLVTASYGQKSHLLEIKPGSSATEWTATAVWTSNSPRTKFSTATIQGDRALAIDEGTLASVDLTNGERVWREGRYGFGQHLQLGDLLLIQSEPGDVVLVRITPEKPEELGRIKGALTSKTWNPPALAGRWLLIRNDREAVCYELQP